MITLDNKWILNGKSEDINLGYVGENEVLTLRIQMADTKYNDWDIVLDVKYSEAKKNIWAVDKVVENGKLVLSILIKKEHIPSTGSIGIQVRATHPDGKVKKSSLLQLNVKGSINAPDVVPSPLPSEFEDYESRIQYIKSEVEADADRAAEAALCAPQIGENGNWYVWNSTTGEMSDTGILASGNAEWNFFSQTPCRLTGNSIGSVKMVCSDGECNYNIYSDTVKDMESQSRSFYGNLTEDTSKGYYEYTLNSAASQWFGVLVKMVFTDLQIGKKYKIYVDTTGLLPGSTTATMMYGQFLLAEAVNGNKGDQIMAPMRISSAGLHGYEFTPTSSDVLFEYYPGNIVAELVEGYQFRFRDLYVNLADADDAHTPIFNQSGTFTGELILPKYTDGLHYEARPTASVYFAEAKSKLFTINGTFPDEDGNIEIPISRLQGRTLVCFGDSITGMFAPPADYPSVIAKLTGMTVHNLGMEGCRMSHHTDQYYDAFSMYKLADAITSGDYSPQEAAVGHTGSYAANRVATLKAIDWSKVDYVTIMYGTNDVQGGVALDNAEDPKDTTTYLGACRYAMEKLWTAYPNLKIMLLTPIYRYWPDTQQDSDEKTFTGGKHLYEFGDGLIEVAKAYKTPTVDLYRTLGINKINRAYYFPVGDGTHPNDLGRALLGEKVAAKLLS